MAAKKQKENKKSQNKYKRQLKTTLKMNKSYVVLLAVFLVFLLLVLLNSLIFRIPLIPDFGRLWGNDTSAPESLSEGDVQVHFVDVGQGDCELIVSKEMTILIDCGEYDRAGVVANYLKKLGIGKLDYVICTHPHSDHIGGMGRIINSVTTANVIMPQIPDDQITTTSSYKSMLDAIDKRSVNVGYCQADTYIPINENCRLEFISPDTVYENINDYSIVCRLVHYDNKFLFAGDIEESAESNIVDSKRDISADVIKVPHHGSRTSALYAFLKKVQPRFAVIEVASPNDFGHPHEKTLKVYDQLDCKVLRTDMNGNIVFISNKGKLEFVTEKG